MAETHSNADAQAADDRVVKKSITVPLAPAAAFQLWTAGIHRWWPPGHSRSGDPGTQVFLEEGVGGRFYERTTTGVEYEWGRVTTWNPPHHLAYSWYLGSSPTQPTQVDVRFVALDGQKTRIDVEHRGPELIGNLWWLNNARYRAAWDVVLPAYGALAA
ncbi:MAG: SRPBCC domain-containing protein [Caldilineaceae bacterium]